MRTLWARIEQWLENNGNAGENVLNKLEKPLTDSDLAELTHVIGARLCDEHEQLLRVHNGTWMGKCSLWGWELHSSKEIAHSWNILTHDFAPEYEGKRAEPHGPVRAMWWNPKWIPIAYNLAGSYYCADLDPAPGGQVGQVLIHWHEKPERRVVAPSFRAWVSQFVDDLEAGKYRVGNDGIEPIPGSGIPAVLE